MNHSLGDIIREKRLQMHYTQASLAEELDVSTGLIGQLERGETNPSYQLLRKLVKTLNIDPRVILESEYSSDNYVDAREIFMLLMEVDEPHRSSVFHMIRLLYRDQKNQKKASSRQNKSGSVKRNNSDTNTNNNT